VKDPPQDVAWELARDKTTTMRTLPPVVADVDAAAEEAEDEAQVPVRVEAKAARAAVWVEGAAEVADPPQTKTRNHTKGPGDNCHPGLFAFHL
jgi:hypothetical protein